MSDPFIILGFIGLCVGWGMICAYAYERGKVDGVRSFFRAQLPNIVRDACAVALQARDYSKGVAEECAREQAANFAAVNAASLSRYGADAPRGLSLLPKKKKKSSVSRSKP